MYIKGEYVDTHIRLSDDEYYYLWKKAGKKGESVGAYMRYMSLTGKICFYDVEEHYNVRAMKFCADIFNNIARDTNINGKFSDSDMRQIKHLIGLLEKYTDFEKFTPKEIDLMEADENKQT